MSAEIISESFRPVEVLHLLIARHGLIRVILALPLAVLKRRARNEVLALPIPAHLARDIGLIAEPVRRMHWEYR